LKISFIPCARVSAAAAAKNINKTAGKPILKKFLIENLLRGLNSFFVTRLLTGQNRLRERAVRVNLGLWIWDLIVFSIPNPNSQIPNPAARSRRRF
jgi:hypothetical protein